MTASIEESRSFTPRLNDAGLIPVVTQDRATGRVLMLAWANEEAIQKTLTTGEAHYWSRSRREIWRKGATSGNVQKVLRVMTDCDQDTLLYEVEQSGPACHTGRRSCFYRELARDGSLTDAS